MEEIIKGVRSNPKGYISGLCGAVKSVSDLMDNDEAQRLVDDLSKRVGNSHLKNLIEEDDTYQKLIHALCFVQEILQVRLDRLDISKNRKEIEDLQSKIKMIGKLLAHIGAHIREAEKLEQERKKAEDERKKEEEFQRLQNENGELHSELARLKEQVASIMKHVAPKKTVKGAIPEEATQILDFSSIVMPKEFEAPKTFVSSLGSSTISVAAVSKTAVGSTLGLGSPNHPKILVSPLVAKAAQGSTDPPKEAGKKARGCFRNH